MVLKLRNAIQLSRHRHLYLCPMLQAESIQDSALRSMSQFYRECTHYSYRQRMDRPDH